MAERKKGKPYIWVTWLTKLLAGENECTWASWLKATHWHEKVDDGSFDLAAWSAAHNKMVVDRANKLKLAGWKVTIEGANDFKLHGKTAIVAGKPDIVASFKKPGKTARVLVVDCKSGRKRDSDWWQVLIYLWALPLVRKDLIPPGAVLSGEVEYSDGVIADVGPRALTKKLEHTIAKKVIEIATFTGSQTPSARECKFCNIGPADCSKRIAQEPHKEAETGAF